MSLSTHTTPSGYLLPSIHSAPPFFTQQPNPATQAVITGHWTKLILSYARHRGLFYLRLEDTENPGNSWDEVLRNERIHRASWTIYPQSDYNRARMIGRLRTSHLSYLLADMVSRNMAIYDPPKQTHCVLLYWRLPEEWAEVLHEWASSTGQLNTILTFYEIIEPPVPSPLSGMPLTLLRKAISILAKTNRAQIITVSDGEGVRLLAGNPTR